MAVKKVCLVYDANGSPVQGALSPYSTTVVAFDGSARNIAPLEGEIVRLIATQDCHIKFGGAVVVATTNDTFLKANQVEYFSLRGNTYIAAIKDPGAGSLYITVMV
jgi:hypothetical protein